MNYFDVIRWARTQAQEHHLKPIEAHVLLLLATYADADQTAWPSIATLTTDAGLTVRGRGNNAVSGALRRLAELGLIETKQAGHGRSARRRLLAQPSSLEDTNVVQLSSYGDPYKLQPSSTEDSKARQPSSNGDSSESQPSSLEDTQPSSREDPKYQEKNQEQLNPPKPPKGGARQRDQDQWEQEQVRPYATRLFPDCNPDDATQVTATAIRIGCNTPELIFKHVERWTSVHGVGRIQEATP